MHYTQIDPSRSNLPRDPITGGFRGGPGLSKGGQTLARRQLVALAKKDLRGVFNLLGGVKGMFDWVRKDPKNEFAFYTQIFPKLLGAETADAVAARFADRPQITRIESVIIDPKNDYKSTLTDEPPQIDRSAQDAEYIEEFFKKQFEESGMDEDSAKLISQEIPL